MSRKYLSDLRAAVYAEGKSSGRNREKEGAFRKCFESAHSVRDCDWLRFFGDCVSRYNAIMHIY